MATLLSCRVTSRLFSHVLRRSLPDLRAYGFLSPNACCSILYTLDGMKKKNVYKLCIPVTNGFGFATFNIQPKAFSSKASAEEPQQVDQDAGPELSEPEQDDTDPVKLLYNFKEIRKARLLSHLKIFQTVVVGVTLPIIYYGYMAGDVSFLMMSSGFVVSTFATIFLYVIGEHIRKTVCIMKYNTEADELMISHLNFWGRRRDVTIPVSNTIPLTEYTPSVYLLKTSDGNETFYLHLTNASEEEKKDILQLLE